MTTLEPSAQLGPDDHSSCPGHVGSPTVLLSVSEQGYPTSCLLRAHALAKLLRARLHVLRVLPEHNDAIRSRGRDADHTCASARIVDALGAARSWVCSALGDGAEVEALTITCGDFVEQTAGYAARNGSRLIVVSPRDRRSTGRSVTALAQTSGIRVLVNRDSREHRTIVAATDLENTAYPVLKAAAAFGRWLAAPVVALHQLNSARSRRFTWRRARRARVIHLAKARELALIAKRLQLASHMVVTSGTSPTDTILREARSRKADLVVVGTHSRPSPERATIDSVCAQIIERARRSVLVAPFAACGPPWVTAGAPHIEHAR